MNNIGFEPLSNYIVCEIVYRKKSKIIHPDGVRLDMKGMNADLIVRAVSEEKGADGKALVKIVKCGDSILLSPGAMYAEIKPYDITYFVLRESDVMGLVTPSSKEVAEKAVYVN